MAALTFPAPSPLNGDALEDEIEAAGQGPVAVLLSGSTIFVSSRDGRALNQTTVGQAVAAHTGQPTATQAATSTRVTDADAALAQLITLAGGTNAVRSKLKNVAAGTDTFTNAQSQRLLAMIGLFVLRDRSDT